MAFLFGPMLPILFVYAFLGMLILYILLRVRLAYSVRRFPSYSQKQNKCMLYLLRYCPIIYTVVATWLYSNQQVFQNTVLANKTHSEYNAKSGHDVSQIGSQLNPGLLFYVVDWCFFVYVMFLVVRYVLLRISPKLFDRCPRFSGSLRTTREAAKFDLIVLERQKQS